MGWPNYMVNGKHVCQHIFCDHRGSRMIATHRVVQVADNGSEWETLVCDQHLTDIRKVLRDNDTVEKLSA